MTDLATTGPSATLALTDEQTGFTDRQTAALTHIGVQNASPGDLEVFFHVCQRSGLDPFARQIYMIGRQVSEKDSGGNWQKVTKQTIQTGIDGFRLIGRRAANRAGHKLSVGAPEWAHEDGSWRPVWVGAWGHPVGARVTIHRDGEPFTATALFDEYKQTKYGGELTAMWAQRPAGQIAKCAEALAWRMAFPQDLSGIYTDEEMSQADSQGRGTTQAPSGPSSADRARQAIADPDPQQVTTERVENSDLTDKTRRHMFALLSERTTDADEQRAGLSHILGREVASRSSITEAEGQQVIAHLTQQDAEGGA